MINKTNEVLDGKANNTLALATATVPLTLGLFYFIFNSLPLKSEVFSSFPFIGTITFMGISILFFVISLVISIALYLPKEFEYVSPQELIDKYQDEEFLSTMQTVSYTIASTVSKNNVVCKEKAKTLRWAQIFVVFGVIALLVAFVGFAFTIQLAIEVT